MSKNSDEKERIINGARELFFKYGIKTVTMDDIAAQLGMSKKTIYKYYNDKKLLVNVVLEKILEQNRNDMELISKNAENAIDEILQITRYIEGMFSSINPVVFFDLRKSYPNAWNKFKKFKEACMSEMVEANLKSGIKHRLFRPELNVKILARMRIVQIESLMNTEDFPPAQFNFAKAQVEVLEHFLYGICTLKGHKLINKYKQIIEEE